MRRAYNKFKARSQPGIVKAFKETRLWPLAAPTSDNQKGLNTGVIFNLPGQGVVCNNADYDATQGTSLRGSDLVLLQAKKAAPNQSLLLRNTSVSFLNESVVSPPFTPTAWRPTHHSDTIWSLTMRGFHFT